MFIHSPRDPARINVVLAKLREVWERNPDLRLAQLVVNAAAARQPCPDIFNLEDEVLLHGLAAFDAMATPAKAIATPANSQQINEVAIPPSDNNLLLDAVYFAATLKHVIEELRTARRSLRYARTEFESLTTEPVLAPEYRKAYAQLAESLRRTEQAIQTAENENQDLDDWISIPHPHAAPVSPATIIAIRRTIEELNAAEIRFVGHCESVIATLREQDGSGLIDWAMPFDYHFTVLLDPGPARAFYETCGNGEEPLRISLGPYSASLLSDYGASYNWNILEGREGHPLRADHHGYLVHCIIDHSVLPWQLMAHIKEIEVRIEFHTFESVWARSLVSLQDPSG
jgi:uncharacterized protein YihD (DUF1040 family)